MIILTNRSGVVTANNLLPSHLSNFIIVTGRPFVKIKIANKNYPICKSCGKKEQKIQKLCLFHKNQKREFLQPFLFAAIPQLLGACSLHPELKNFGLIGTEAKVNRHV
jgi:hypothetical protein